MERRAQATPVVRRTRSGRDLVDFLVLWLDMLTQLCAAATCARTASATMDYMSNGRSRVWLFGYESHSLGEPWPDVLGVTIVVVVTAMFMLGLDVRSGISFCTYFFVNKLKFRYHIEKYFWKVGNNRCSDYV